MNGKSFSRKQSCPRGQPTGGSMYQEKHMAEKLQAQAACKQEVQEAVASEVLSLGREIVDRASALRSHVEKKLEPISLPETEKEKCGNSTADRNYPPLFSELRSIFYEIMDSLNAINNNINRTAL